MKILYDICHPAQLNFFKNSIEELTDLGYDVIVCHLDRGRLSQIVRKELKKIKGYQIGKHKGSKYSIIFQANILRFLAWFPILIKERPQICLSVGSFTNGFACKIMGIPNIQFDDDPERRINVVLEKFSSTELYFPPIKTATNKIKNFNALKEWAYLSPRYFKPDKNVLNKYSLIEDRYIFIREVSSGSLNYSSQSEGIISNFANRLPLEFKVIFSLENKSNRKLYPSNWIDLDEPVENIHSIIYYSRYIISSGDSMAREGAILGVPSIYCGNRFMKANQILKDKGMLFTSPPNKVPDLIQELEKGMILVKNKADFRKELMDEWIDVTDFILEIIKKHER